MSWVKRASSVFAPPAVFRGPCEGETTWTTRRPVLPPLPPLPPLPLPRPPRPPAMIFVSRVFVWVCEPAGVAVADRQDRSQALARKIRITRGTDGSTINGPDYLTYKILQFYSTFHYSCHSLVGKQSYRCFEIIEAISGIHVDLLLPLSPSCPAGTTESPRLFGQGAGDRRSTRPLEGAPGSEPWRRSVGPPRRRRSCLGRPHRVRALTSASATGTGGWRGGYPARSRRRRAKGRMGPMGRLVSALDRGD